MINTRKTAALLLSAMLLSSLMAGCGSSQTGSETLSTEQTEAQSDETTAAGEETTETDPLNEFASLDFEGAAFRISALDRNSYEIYSEEENGEVCNDAVFERNRKVEELLNIVVEPKLIHNNTESDHQNEVTRASLAGEDAYDLVALIVYKAGTPITQGVFRRWNDIPYVDMTKPWWISRANEAFDVGGRQYAAVGDLGITSMLTTYGTFYNKTLAADYDMPDLYQTVYDGDWTIDKLDTLAAGVYSDLNGDGTHDSGDLYGYTAEQVINCDVMLASFGQPVISKDGDGLPYVTINTPKTVSAVEKIYKLFWENDGSFIVPTWGEELPIFASGRALFITTYLDNAFSTFRDMDDEYGILPFPKYDEAQEEYLSDARDHYSVFCIPVTAQRSELIGAAVETLNITSRDIVYPAYYETALKTKYVSDSDSVAMIDLLMAGRNYDFSILHGEGLNMLPYLVRQLMNEKSKDFTSKYAALEDQINSSLQKIVDTYMSLEA